MARLLRSAAVLVLVISTYAALPPGYEDELYCPSTHCLHKRAMPAGFTGPRSAFWECAFAEASSADDTTPSQRPSPWGSNHGEDARRMLLAEGYHMDKCATEGTDEVDDEVQPGVNPGAQPGVEPDVNIGDEERDVNAGGERPGRQQKIDEIRKQAEENGQGSGATSAGKMQELMPAILGAAAVAFAAYVFLIRKPTIPATTPEQKARLDAARKQRLEKLEKETEEIRGSDEWKVREQAAKDEVDGHSIKPEHRRAGAAMGRPGHDQTSVRKSR